MFTTQTQPLQKQPSYDFEGGLTIMLRDCGLAERLHDRALLETNHNLWGAGYTRGREKQHRLADLIGRKLHLPQTGLRGLDVRARIIEKSNDTYFNLPETLDFLTWAQKVNRPTRCLDTFSKSPVAADKSREILTHLFEISFGLSADEAIESTDLIRRRELDDISRALEQTLYLMSETAKRGVHGSVYSCFSSASFGVNKALLGKAAAGGLKLKLAYAPLIVAGGITGTVTGAVAVVSLASGCLFSMATAYSAVCTGRVLWRDRFEIGRQSLRDAAVFGAIATLNEEIEQADVDPIAAQSAEVNYA